MDPLPAPGSLPIPEVPAVPAVPALPEAPALPEGVPAPADTAPPPSPAPEPAQTSARWQGTAAQGTGSSGLLSRREWNLATSSLLLLALLGALLAWICYPRSFPQPYFLTLTISEYQDPHYPALPFAEQDSTTLMDALAGVSEQNRSWAFQKQQRGLLLRELQTLGERKDQPVVFHLRAHGLVWGDKVMVLPADARPDQPETWVSLEEVIESLRKCPARYKLLLLDLMGPLEDPRLGILEQDVSTRVDESLKSLKGGLPPGLLVFCSCGPREQSLVSEELRQSVFSHYVCQGLRGEADRFRTAGNRNLRVTVAELVSYVSSQVESWASQHRGLRQKPILLGNPTDADAFEIVQVRQAPATEPETPPAEPYPDWLLKQWQMRESWLKDQTFRAHPQAMLRLEADLLWAEQRWRGGRTSEAVHNSLKEDLQTLQEQARQARLLAFPPSRTPPHSLALKRPRSEETIQDQLRQFLDATEKLPPPEQAVQVKALVEKVRAAKVSYEDLAGMALDAALSRRAAPTKVRVQLLHSVLRESAGPRQTTYVETLLLGRLAEWPVQSRDWPVKAVQLLLDVVVQEERLLTADPCALLWFTNVLNQIAQQRRKGEKLLFDDWPDRAAPALEKVRDQLQSLPSQIKIIEDAQFVLDEAAVLLPGLLQTLVREWEGSGSANLLDRTTLEQDWLETVATLASLQQRCDRLRERLAARDPSLKPSTIDQGLQEINQDRIVLKGHLESLRRPFSPPAVKELLEQAERNRPALSADYRTLCPLARSPLLSSADRSRLQTTRRELDLRLTQTAQAMTMSGSDLVSESAKHALAIRKAKLVQALLTLAGADDLTGLQELSRQTEQDPSLANLQRLADQLRQTWSGMARQVQEAQRFPVARRLLLALHPFDDSDWSHFPSARIRNEEITRYRDWLNRRLEEEGR